MFQDELKKHGKNSVDYEKFKDVMDEQLEMLRVEREERDKNGFSSSNQLLMQ